MLSLILIFNQTSNNCFETPCTHCFTARKTRGFIAFSAIELQYFGKNLNLAFTLSNFLISNLKNIPIMY